MKKTFFVLILYFPLTILYCSSQTTMPVDTVTKFITYTATVNSANSSKEELLARAKRWYDKTYKNSSSAKYEMDYGKSQLRISKVLLVTGDNDDEFVYYTVNINCADNQYTYYFSNFYHDSYKGNGGALEGTLPACGKCIGKNSWERVKYQTDLYVKMLISSLESAMEKK